MIRPAKSDDAVAIDRIYNQAITAGFHTADIAPYSSAKRTEWLNHHLNDTYPVFVFEDQGRIKGWCSLSPYRAGRQALIQTAEISFYIDFEFHRQGIGQQLIRHTLDHADKTGLHVLFAVIIEKNLASQAILKKFGFEQWGYLPEVIYYNHAFTGQVYLGKILGNEPK